MKSKITNVEVAKLLGVSDAVVSRYRSGDRVPSLEVMLKIRELDRWDLTLQAISKQAGKWHEGFEAVLVDEHGKEEDEHATTNGAPA